MDSLFFRLFYNTLSSEFTFQIFNYKYLSWNFKLHVTNDVGWLEVIAIKGRNTSRI